ncbi:protein of unknown function [Pseudomonas sp. JV551A1]|nr:protein of unknown function [Pseudomonas sp. JV551A1]
MGAALCRERAAKQPQSFSADAQIAGAASQPFRDTRPLPQGIAQAPLTDVRNATVAACSA